MIYVWRDKNSGKRIEVSRKVKDINQTPDKDECIDQDMGIEEYAAADWERVVNPSAHIGDKGKGFW